MNDPRRCWAPMGIRPGVHKQMIRELTYVFATVSPFDGIMDSLILPEVNAVTMSIFLDEVSMRHLDEFVLIVMDKAGWHRSGELAVPPNIGLTFFPPYSPQLNPVELIWDELVEKWFANLAFQSLKGVEDVLEGALLTLENSPSRLRQLTGFNWIVSVL